MRRGCLIIAPPRGRFQRFVLLCLRSISRASPLLERPLGLCRPTCVVGHEGLESPPQWVLPCCQGSLGMVSGREVYGSVHPPARLWLTTERDENGADPCFANHV